MHKVHSNKGAQDNRYYNMQKKEREKGKREGEKKLSRQLNS